MSKISPLEKFFVLTSCVLFFVLVPSCQAFDAGNRLVYVAPRQILSDLTTTPQASSPPATTTTTAPASTTPTPTSTTTPATTPSAQPTSTTGTTTSTSPTSTPTSGTTTTPPPSQSPTPPAPQSSITSQVESTNANGQITTIVVTVPVSSTSADSSGSPTSQSGASSSSTASSGGSSSLGTGSIIGLSVSGGVALIGIIAFIIWKFTRKRFSDRFDDSEAIKWPELNNESHALPTHPTGGAGFSNEANLSRAGSLKGGYADSIGTGSQSQVDLYAADPYAVPPLPHLNPNQPPQGYRDDPNAGAYYDPYSGPAPPSFHDIPGTQGEAIPMNQIPPGSRARSPGPHYGMSSPAPSMGRQSPGPYGAMHGPAGYGTGRQSPGPSDAYGYGR